MKRGFNTVAVYGPDHAVILMGMQAMCLPDDRPQPVSEGRWWLVTDREGQPAAFASMTEARASLGGHTGHLSRAGVLPAYRGNSLQLSLIKVREECAKLLGWRTLVSNTFDNPQSGNNLIHAGFHLFDPEEPWGIDGTNYWRKEIS